MVSFTEDFDHVTSLSSSILDSEKQTDDEEEESIPEEILRGEPLHVYNETSGSDKSVILPTKQKSTALTRIVSTVQLSMKKNLLRRIKSSKFSPSYSALGNSRINLRYIDHSTITCIIIEKINTNRYPIYNTRHYNIRIS